MKSIKTCLLWLVTGALPVVIAACYGPLYRFSKHGRVVDKDTQEGVPGIQVTCLGEDQAEHSMDFTGEDGTFFLRYDVPCDVVAFEDVDGDENGTYLATQVPFGDDEEEELLVELEPAS